MSLKATSAVWAHSQQSGSRLLMLLALADFADETGMAWALMETLANKCRVIKRNAQKAIEDLKEAGELEVIEGEGKRGSNVFRITIMNGPVSVAGEHPQPEPEALAQAPAPSDAPTPPPAPAATETEPDAWKLPTPWAAWCKANAPSLSAQDVAPDFIRAHATAPTLEAWKRFCKDTALQLNSAPRAGHPALRNSQP
jgi:Helix-turn-helix domain